MAIAHVQTLGTGVTTATGGTHTLTVPANQSSLGNELILILSDQGDSVTSISDSKSNTWTIQKDFLNAGLDVAIATCIPTSALTTSDTITVTCSNTGFAVLWGLEEFSGLTQTLDGTPQTGTTSTVSGLTTTNANDLILAAFSDFHSGAVTFTAASGYTAGTLVDIGSPGSFHLWWEWEIVSSTGAQTTSGTSISSGQISGILLALKATAAAVVAHNLTLLGVG